MEAQNMTVEDDVRLTAIKYIQGVRVQGGHKFMKSTIVDAINFWHPPFLDAVHSCFPRLWQQCAQQKMALPRLPRSNWTSSSSTISTCTMAVMRDGSERGVSGWKFYGWNWNLFCFVPFNMGFCYFRSFSALEMMDSPMMKVHLAPMGRLRF